MTNVILCSIQCKTMHFQHHLYIVTMAYAVVDIRLLIEGSVVLIHSLLRITDRFTLPVAVFAI